MPKFIKILLVCLICLICLSVVGGLAWWIQRLLE